MTCKPRLSSILCLTATAFTARERANQHGSVYRVEYDGRSWWSVRRDTPGAVRGVVALSVVPGSTDAQVTRAVESAYLRIFGVPSGKVVRPEWMRAAGRERQRRLC